MFVIWYSRINKLNKVFIMSFEQKPPKNIAYEPSNQHIAPDATEEQP